MGKKVNKIRGIYFWRAEQGINIQWSSECFIKYFHDRVVKVKEMARFLENSVKCINCRFQTQELTHILK